MSWVKNCASTERDRMMNYRRFGNNPFLNETEDGYLWTSVLGMQFVWEYSLAHPLVLYLNVNGQQFKNLLQKLFLL